MSGLAGFAKLLGLRRDHAEDALHSERAARVVLTRRNLFAAGAALTSGAVFSTPAPARQLVRLVCAGGETLGYGDHLYAPGPAHLNATAFQLLDRSRIEAALACLEAQTT